MRDRSRLLLTGIGCLILGVLVAPRWSAQEPAALKGGKSPAYHMVLVSAGNGWEVLRYKADTGEAWVPRNMVWQKVTEPDNLPAGDYDIQMVGLPAVNTVEATRMERGSGRAWVMRNTKWTEIGESK